MSIESMMADLEEVRQGTLGLVSDLPQDALEQVHSELLSPIVWDLGHIAAFEDLWLVRNFGEGPMIRPDLGEVYDAFETPRAGRGELPFLRLEECLAYLDTVREKTQDVVAKNSGLGDGFIFEMVLRHELQHCETILQTMQLAHIAPTSDEETLNFEDTGSTLDANSCLDMVEIPAGVYSVGADQRTFAYDNERSLHQVEAGGFQIAKTPVTNQAFGNFVDEGGYRERKWWSDEGWLWRTENQIERPLHWTQGGDEWRLGNCLTRNPRRPVVHVSWYEAAAFANSRDLRLPSEIEWEIAATHDLARSIKHAFPWGSEQPTDARANLGHTQNGPTAVGSLKAGCSISGCYGMMGDVWEWTSSHFTAYPNFEAYPYREYSEVFFGDNYRVLRGGSWATHPRAVTATFRNWDLPQRRQIFSGFRVADGR